MYGPVSYQEGELPLYGLQEDGNNGLNGESFWAPELAPMDGYSQELCFISPNFDPKLQ